MNRELSEQELEHVRAGFQNVRASKAMENELDIDDLGSVKAGLHSFDLAREEALKNPELYRDKSLDAIVEEIIASQEIENNSQDEVHGMRK